MTSEPTPTGLRITEIPQDDSVKAGILHDLTGGQPYVLLSMEEKEDGGLTLTMDAGGGVNDREDVEFLIGSALQHLRAA